MPRRNPQAQRARFDGMFHRRYQNEEREYRQDMGRDQHHGVKLTIPQFAGTSDVEAYMDWESKVESIFDYYGYHDAQRVAVATIHFSDFAYSWWQEEKQERAYMGYPPITTWEDLKTALRERFVPEDYVDRVQVKLERIKQGSRTPDEFYKELKQLVFRSGIRFPERYVISKFIGGLNLDTVSHVEMQRFGAGTQV